MGRETEIEIYDTGCDQSEQSGEVLNQHVGICGIFCVAFAHLNVQTCHSCYLNLANV